jgi:hypothetical protein
MDIRPDKSILYRLLQLTKNSYPIDLSFSKPDKSILVIIGGHFDGSKCSFV